MVRLNRIRITITRNLLLDAEEHDRLGRDGLFDEAMAFLLSALLIIV